MTKSDLIDTLRKETTLSKSKSEQVIELFFERRGVVLNCSIFYRRSGRVMDRFNSVILRATIIHLFLLLLRTF